MATKGEPLAPAEVAAGGGRPRALPSVAELTGLPQDDGAARGMVPQSMSIQAKGLVPALPILLAPCPLDAQGWDLAKLGHFFPHSKGP